MFDYGDDVTSDIRERGCRDLGTGTVHHILD